MIKLLVSDVDGTLLAPDKTLAAATKQAIARLRAAGIAFTIVSARPPFGMGFIAKELAIDLPYGAYNGSLTVGPFADLPAHGTIPAATAKATIDHLAKLGISVWLFTPDHWIIRDANGPYVAHEQRTIAHDPLVGDDFSLYLLDVCKIVGVSEQPDLLTQAQTTLAGHIGTAAMIARSQSYYLDITPSGFDKGTFVESIARRLSLSADSVAVIGDMPNDMPMFAKAKYTVAMGNGPEQVRQQAGFVTATNAQDGFAAAVDHLLSLKS